MSLIPGLSQSKKRTRGEKIYEAPPFDDSLSIEEKLESIVIKKAEEGAPEYLSRVKIYYAMELMYRGYHHFGDWSDTAATWQVYDDEPLEYHENQFRKDVTTVRGMLIKGSPDPILRPGSENVDDIEASKNAEKAWEVIKDDIDYPQLQSREALFQCLYGNVFDYAGYLVNERLFGVTEVPRYKYESLEIPGASICMGCGVTQEAGMADCPECGMPMSQLPAEPIEERIFDGVDKRPKGQNFALALSPLHIKIRSNVLGGPAFWPYVIWSSLEDADIVKSLGYYTKNTNQGVSTADPNRHRYLDTLASIAGTIGRGVMDTGFRGSAPVDYDRVHVIRAWLTPEMFRGDKELLAKYPDGCVAVLIDGECQEHRAEKIVDVWTHKTLYDTPHSAYGDGMFDAIPVQLNINLAKQLFTRHIDYSSLQLTAFDRLMFDPKDVTNDPASRLIPVNRQMDQNIAAGFHTIPAAQLNDVPSFLAMQYQALHDVTGANNPSSGKDIGANTPYSAYVLLDERAQGRFMPALRYNSGQVQMFTRQQLQIAQREWIDERKLTEIDRNTGKLSWSFFSGANLAKGSWDVKVSLSDFKPKTRAEQMQGLEVARNFNIDLLSSPKSRLMLFDTLGLPFEDNISVQVRRAYRQIERMKRGEQIEPVIEIDDPQLQIPVMQQFLADEEGEDLAIDNPLAFSAVYAYLWGLKNLQMQQMTNDPTKQQGAPPQQGQEPKPPTAGLAPKMPGGQPGQMGGGPPQTPGQGQEMSQSPVPPGNQQVGPAMPAGAR